MPIELHQTPVFEQPSLSRPLSCGFSAAERFRGSADLASAASIRSRRPSVFRGGHELSLRKKGDDHEETLAYLAALAAYLQTMGKSAEAAEFQREHAALAGQLAAQKAASPSPAGGELK